MAPNADIICSALSEGEYVDCASAVLPEPDERDLRKEATNGNITLFSGYKAGVDRQWEIKVGQLHIGDCISYAFFTYDDALYPALAGFGELNYSAFSSSVFDGTQQQVCVSPPVVLGNLTLSTYTSIEVAPAYSAVTDLHGRTNYTIDTTHSTTTLKYENAYGKYQYHIDPQVLLDDCAIVLTAFFAAEPAIHTETQ